MSIIVVLPVCAKDQHLAIRNLEWCIQLDGKCDFRALLAHERGFDPGPVLDLASRYFEVVDLFVYDKWNGERDWPIPHNKAWQEVARHIESKVKLPWFWWEQDAVPIKAGWLPTIVSAHVQGGRQLTGPLTTSQGLAYIAGVAIYPWDVSVFMPRALLSYKEPWDKVARRHDGVMSKAHDISSLIVHTPDVVNTVFDSMDDVYRLIPESAVMFHKNKDGSLLDVLQGKAAAIPESEAAPKLISASGPAFTLDRSIPSFTEQTEWPSGYFTFPTQTHTCYFNCSICEHDGSMHLFTRRERYNLEQLTGGALQGRKNDLAIWRVRENMTLHPTPLLPACPSRYPHEQWEDPRVVIGEDGRAYVSFATWIHHKNYPGRQSFTRLSSDWRKVEVLFEPPFGNNARKPELQKGWEKNWIWFQNHGKWHCVYSINPHVVFSASMDGSVLETHKPARPIKLPWSFGEPRGGTPPIRIGDEYLCFFHSSQNWQDRKRRYFMGAYTFDAEPPFEIRRMTTTPLLVGSDQDFRHLGGPLVIFPSGALLKNNEFLVVFGVNDEACGWIKIPSDAIEGLLETVNTKGIIQRVREYVTA